MSLATVIRLEFAYPGVGVLAGDSLQYLSVATAHGVIMVFYMIMPAIFGAFGNFLLPTQLGVHDVAFPRLNSAAFWFLPGGLIMLCQLVCTDRRYARMNCFNIRELQSILRNGDVVNVITSKSKSPSLHWLPVTKTGKARAAIRKYWHDKGEEKSQRIKKYNTTIWMSLPDKPGKLGEVTTLVGYHKLNISNVEMKEKTKEYINFRFDLIIKDLKNFTNFISELKQKEIKFKIIRHEDKRNAFTQKIFRYFKKN